MSIETITEEARGMELAELRELTRIRQHIITELTQKRNYVRRLLDSVFPEIFTVFRKSLQNRWFISGE